MGWTIFLAVILILVGLFLAIKPDLWWQLTESWKSYSAGDPSDLYLKTTRIGGIIFIVLGVIAIFLPFILE